MTEYQYHKLANDAIYSLTDWELEWDDNHITLSKGFEDNYETKIFNNWEEVYEYLIAIGLLKKNKVKENVDDVSAFSDIDEEDIKNLALKFNNLDNESIINVLTLLEYVPAESKQTVLDLLQIIFNNFDKREVI